MDISDLVWGEGDQLTPLQMSTRALIMFFVALILLRIAGKRSFGKNSALDTIIGIMLGAILARGVVGASPYISSIAAAFIISVVHRIIARVSVNQDWLGNLVKGEARMLFKNGEIKWNEMEKEAVSEKDLMEGVRMEGNVNSLNEIKEAYMERSGEISVVKKNN